MIAVENLTASQIGPLVDDPISLLLGSGISIWEPTSLPTGKVFGAAIFRTLFEDSVKDANAIAFEELEKLFSKIPFENVMEKCPDPLKLTALLTQIYNVTRYNNLHRLIAEALIKDKLSSIVTTNYDCCIDQALADLCGSAIGPVIGPVTRIFGEKDLLSSTVNNHLYFKIHGSADDVTGESLIFQLRHESSLPEWKRTLLKSIIRNHTLLVIGYSGLDFEICPEISALKPAQVFWNVLSESDITPNARMVLEKNPGEIIVGDMRKLLSVTLGLVQANVGSPSINIEAILRSNFSKESLLLWRARVLNNLSYGRAALVVLNDLKANTSAPTKTIDVLEEQARGLHYIGAYKRAALTYEEATRVAKAIQLPNEIIYDLLLAACDNWRCYGGFRRASKKLREAETLAAQAAINRGALLASGNLKHVLLLRRRYQIAELFGASRYKNRVTRKAEVLLRASAEALLSSGRWFEVQQLRLWADRFDLPAEVTQPQGLYELPPSREGYEHLGFPMAQMMVFRDDVETGKRLPDRNAAGEALEKAELAIRLGLRTEVWKLNYLLLKKFPEHRNRRTLETFLRNFFACEYSLLMRCLLLLIRP
jgi:hypothetical protein